VRGQMLSAYRLLEAEIGAGGSWLLAARPLQPDISTAVAWRFTQSLLAEMVTPAEHPGLAAFSKRAEALPEFIATPLE
jgi:hypothetical protein